MTGRVSVALAACSRLFSLWAFAGARVELRVLVAIWDLESAIGVKVCFKAGRVVHTRSHVAACGWYIRYLQVLPVAGGLLQTEDELPRELHHTSLQSPPAVCCRPSTRTSLLPAKPTSFLGLEHFHFAQTSALPPSSPDSPSSGSLTSSLIA